MIGECASKIWARRLGGKIPSRVILEGGHLTQEILLHFSDWRRKSSVRI
jgi:hypothetical protein